MSFSYTDEDSLGLKQSTCLRIGQSVGCRLQVVRGRIDDDYHEVVTQTSEVLQS